jgi:glycosyltransferase involved in cell wall biosynthesis
VKTVVYVQPTSEVGGSDIALFNLVSHLDRRAYRPVVVVPRPGPLVPMLQAAGVRTLVHPMLQLRPVKDPAYQLRYLAAFGPTVLSLVRLLRREGADLVHTNSLYSLYGAWAAWVARVPHVWHVREIPDVPRPLSALMAAMALRRSVRVIPMTEAVGRVFQRRRPKPQQVQAIPDGIDLTRFHPGIRGDRIRDALGIAPGVPLVGWVARLDPWKGADVFVRAAAAVSARYPDTRFLVCGGELPGYEAYATGVQELAASLGLGDRIAFTGWTYRLDDIPEVMAAVDVLVHTSVRPEPFGLVLVEAMATAKPVVAAADGGVPEVVEAGVTGLLVPPGDSAGVAGAIVALLSHSSKAAAMGWAARARAERLFDVRDYANRIEGLYASILVPRTRAQPRPDRVPMAIDDAAEAADR